MDHDEEVEEVCLKTRVEALEKVAVGQAAMIAFLCATLVKKGVLTALDVQVVIMAGSDSQDYEGLDPATVTTWAIKNFRAMLKEAKKPE